MHTNVPIKKTPNENLNDVSAPKSTSKDKLDGIKLYEREKRKQNVFIRGMQEEKSKNALLLC